MQTTEKNPFDPFLKTVYQLALAQSGQLTSDELNTTLKETVPAMKAALEAAEEPEEQQPQQPQY